MIAKLKKFIEELKNKIEQIFQKSLEIEKTDGKVRESIDEL